MEENPYKAPREAGASQPSVTKPKPGPLWRWSVALLSLALAPAIALSIRLDWAPIGIGRYSVPWLFAIGFASMGWGIAFDNRRYRNIGGVLLLIFTALLFALHRAAQK